MLNLYEHQSTFNPNMPTRALLYFAKLYEKYIAAHEINIYSSAPKKLPFPQHIVFYNGSKDEPDRQILRLSDLFKKPSADLTPCLECTSLMLNINYGHNQELMEKCRRLKEYSLFIDTVRRNLASGLPLEQAVSQSVDECIQNIRASSRASRFPVSGRMYSEGYFEGYPDCSESRGDPGGTGDI